jgi:hypothetical protein
MGWWAVSQWTGDQSPTETEDDDLWSLEDMVEAWYVRAARMDVRH